MKRLTILGIIACVVMLVVPASVLAKQPSGIAGNVTVVNPSSNPVPVEGDVNATVTGDVNVANEPTVHVGSPADVNVVNEPTVHVARGEPFQKKVTVSLDAGHPHEFESLEIGDGNRLEVEYISIYRPVLALGYTPSEKVTVRLHTYSFATSQTVAGFTVSDFGWTGAIGGEKVLLHIDPGEITDVYVQRDTVSDEEIFWVTIVGRLFPLE